jgi:drug/metabolite transporter (DMT)-like permease
LLLLGLVWGAGMVAIKMALHDLPPVTLAAVRSATAGLALWTYLKFAHEPLRLAVPRALLVPLAMCAATYTMNIVLLHLGMTMIPAGRATVLFFTQPVLVTFLAPYVFSEERASIWRIAGVLLAFVGFVVVFVPELRTDRIAPLGDLLVVAGAVSWAITALSLRRTVASISPAAAVVWQMAISTPVLAVLALTLEGTREYQASVPTLAAIVYLAIGHIAFGFALWGALMKRHGASVVSAFMFLVPLCSLALGLVMLGETPTWYLLTGTGLIAGGIVVSSRPVPAA